MKYRVEIPGFESQEVLVEQAGFFKGAKVYLNGQQAEKGSKWGSLGLTRDDGTQVDARMVNNMVDPIPSIMVDGEKYHPTEPLSWLQYIWAGWPVILLFVGGFLGALVGIIAGLINGRIFRMELSTPLKYIITGVIAVGGVGVYFVLAMIVTILVG